MTIRDDMALAIARQHAGWNEDTTEPERPGWSEALRLAVEQHWLDVNAACLESGYKFADAILARFDVTERPSAAPTISP